MSPGPFGLNQSGWPRVRKLRDSIDHVINCARHVGLSSLVLAGLDEQIKSYYGGPLMVRSDL